LNMVNPRIHDDWFHQFATDEAIAVAMPNEHFIFVRRLLGPCRELGIEKCLSAAIGMHRGARLAISLIGRRRSCGDFGVSFLQDIWRLLQRWMCGAGTVRHVLRQQIQYGVDGCAESSTGVIRLAR